MPFPSTVHQWLADQAVPLALVAFALLMGLFLLFLSAAARRSAIARRRAGRSEQTFVDELAAYGYDPAIARLTYRTLRQQHRIDFPIEPGDDLETDLGLDPADLRHLTRHLLHAAEREYTPGTLFAPITTVAHLVRHVQTSPATPTPATPRRGRHIA
ncbi:MAG: hypothetical protein M3O02_00805 [Acidobacteriota bacterium]|nr:hypothetical protein [Acidobacteriota bacterium]